MNSTPSIPNKPSSSSVENKKKEFLPTLKQQKIIDLFERQSHVDTKHMSKIFDNKQALGAIIGSLVKKRILRPESRSTATNILYRLTDRSLLPND